VSAPSAASARSAYQLALGLTGWMLEGLDEAGQARAKQALWDSLAAHVAAEGVTYASATWLITARKA